MESIEFHKISTDINGISMNTMDAMETMHSVQSMGFPLVRVEPEACLLCAMAPGDLKAPIAMVGNENIGFILFFNNFQ